MIASVLRSLPLMVKIYRCNRGNLSLPECGCTSFCRAGRWGQSCPPARRGWRTLYWFTYSSLPFGLQERQPAKDRNWVMGGAPLLLRAGATTRKQICLKGQKEEVLSLPPSQGGHFPPPRALHSCTTWACPGYDDRKWPQ